MCGPAKRIWRLSPDKMCYQGDQKLENEACLRSYDAALKKVSLEYCNQMHNLVLNNCHSHVASVLNEIKYDGRCDWNQLRVFISLWRHGRWASKSAAIRTFAPLGIIVVLIGILCCVGTIAS